MVMVWKEFLYILSHPSFKGVHGNIAKLSSSWLVKWLVELRLALSLIITTPTHPPPPGKVEMQPEIDHI